MKGCQRLLFQAHCISYSEFSLDVNSPLLEKQYRSAVAVKCLLVQRIHIKLWKVDFVRAKYIQQPERGEAAPASCPQV